MVQLLNKKNKKGESLGNKTCLSFSLPSWGLAVCLAKAPVYYFVLSSFSSSMSFREALTLLDTSFPWEKSRWRSLKVILSGASPVKVFSCS